MSRLDETTYPCDMDRLRRLMADAGLDAVLAWGGANFRYVTGFQNYFDNPGGSIALIPADPALSPMILVASWMADAADAASRIRDIETFPLWLEIGDLEAIRQGTETRRDKPSPRYDLPRNMQIIAAALESRGLAAGRIGLERNLVSTAAFESLSQALPQARFSEAGGVFTDLRAIKTPWEIECLEEATRYAEAGLQALTQQPLKGLDTAGLKRLFDEVCATRAAKTPDNGYLGTRITASIGAAVSPTVAGGPTITGDELVFFDCGVSIHGYGADTGRTLCLKPPSDEARRFMDAVCAGMAAAEPLLKPGTPMNEIFHAGQNAVRTAGLDWFTRGHIGHTMGLGMGEQGPYLSPMETRPLAPGMVIALETPLYVRGLGGFQVEECYVITDDGARRFTTLPRNFLSARL